MKALFIVHSFPPIHAGGSYRSEAFARYLPDHGITPVVVCDNGAGGNPFHLRDAAWKDDPRWDEVRRIEWGLPQKLDEAGLLTRFGWRMPLGFSAVRTAFRRRVVETVLAEARRAVERERPDVIYASAPPEEALMAAARLSGETGIPAIADLRDPWSHFPKYLYRHYVDFLIERGIERRVLRRFSFVIANTAAARELLVSAVRLDPERVRHLPNGYDEKDFTGLRPNRSAPSDQFVIVHAGALETPFGNRRSRGVLGFDYEPLHTDYSTRTPRWFLAAIERLLDREPRFRDVVRVVFVGSDNDRWRSLKSQFKYPDCLEIRPRLPKQEALSLCAGADLLLLFSYTHFIDGKRSGAAIPAKLFDYLRLGRRILALTHVKDIADILQKFRSGVAVDAVNVQAIESVLAQELERWEREGPAPARVPQGIEEYDRASLTSRLAEWLKAIAAEGAAPRGRATA